MNKAGLLVVTQIEIQSRLRGYGLKQDEQFTVEQIQAFADTYKGRELKEMYRTAGCYAGVTKYAMAASLIKKKHSVACAGLKRLEMT